MTVRRTLKLGTRSSLLAIAQSKLVAAALQEQHPDIEVKLVDIVTRGDRDLGTPLADVSDPDYFSAELDAALLDGRVDFCVHSWKDLDRTRPTGLSIAAVPVRELPHDAIVFRSDILERLQAGQRLRIGSSSLRRQINIGDFLPTALPATGQPVNFEITSLRGPVDQRLARITANAGDDRLDGVVLALAGLARLYNDPGGRAAIEPALRHAKWMILPLSECPAAPAQAALAVECRSNDTATLTLLESIHDPITAQLVATENDLVQEYGRGQPTAFGATAVCSQELGFVARLRGRIEMNSPVYACTTGKPLSKSDASIQPWAGTGWRNCTNRKRLPVSPLTAPALFFAHSDALDAGIKTTKKRCWTSGVSSWKALAKQGVWVEGCADNLGFENLRPLLACPVLALPQLADWAVVTHADAMAGWSDSGIGQVVASYSLDITPEAGVLLSDELSACTHFFWASARQYLAVRDKLPNNAHHACGTGKTAAALRAAGLTNVQPFPSRKEWQQWLA